METAYVPEEEHHSRSACKMYPVPITSKIIILAQNISSFRLMPSQKCHLVLHKGTKLCIILRCKYIEVSE